MLAVLHWFKYTEIVRCSQGQKNVAEHEFDLRTVMRLFLFRPLPAFHGKSLFCFETLPPMRGTTLYLLQTRAADAWQPYVCLQNHPTDARQGFVSVTDPCQRCAATLRNACKVLPLAAGGFL